MNKTKPKKSLLEDTIDNCLIQLDAIDKNELLSQLKKFLNLDEKSNLILELVILSIKIFHNCQLIEKKLKELEKNAHKLISNYIYIGFAELNFKKKQVKSFTR